MSSLEVDVWRTSSYSANGDACVEVALREADVHVRDTKDRDGGELSVCRSHWHALLARVR